MSSLKKKTKTRGDRHLQPTCISWKCFTRCRRQAPTGRHANPTLAGGSDDEAACANRCGQERLLIQGAWP